MNKKQIIEGCKQEIIQLLDELIYKKWKPNINRDFIKGWKSALKNIKGRLR